MKKLNFIKVVSGLMFVTVATATAFADIGANQQIALEAQLQSRILAIVSKADKQAIVQVRVDVRKMSSALPGVWTDAKQITPVSSDGSLAADGIEAIHVRIVSQMDEVPGWIKDEVKKSLSLDNVRIDTKFEKAKGSVSEEAKVDSTLETIKNVGKDIVDGLAKTGPGEIGTQISFALWGLVVGLVVTMILLSGAIMLLGRKIESSFFRVIDEKLAPLLQAQAATSGRRDRASEKSSEIAASKASPASGAKTSHENALAELSDSSIFAIVVDCYWTYSDGYAHYIWNELNRKQRDALLAHATFGAELFRYFQFVRQFPADNLGYHQDVQYVDVKNTYALVDQTDVSQFIGANPAMAAYLTPLRWDLLPISLSDRLKATAAMNAEAVTPLASVSALQPSRFRALPRKLEVKNLTADDEAFLWSNPETVTASVRTSLKTLVWLALTPLKERESILGEVDARDLAEAWSGPAQVLERLKEAIPARKFEMVQSYLKDSTPDRGSAIFEHLVESGARALEANQTPSSQNGLAA